MPGAVQINVPAAHRVCGMISGDLGQLKTLMVVFLSEHKWLIRNGIS